MKPTPTPTPVRGQIRRGSWRWLVAAALLTAVGIAIPLREVTGSIARASVEPALLAAGLALVMHVVQAVRLWLLANSLGLHWRFVRILRIHFSSMAYALVLPGGNIAGMVVRAYRIGQPHQNLVAAGVTMLVDRLIATTTLGLTGLVCLALVETGGMGVLASIFGAVIVACLTLLGAAAVGPRRLPGFRVIERWSVLGPIIRRLDGLQQVPVGAMAVGGLLATGIHLMGIATFMLVALSLGMPLSFAEVGLARAVMLVAALLPVSVAGLGLREGAAVLVLGALGERHGAAVALSLVVFVLVWVVPGVVGALIEAGGLIGQRRVREGGDTDRAS